MAKKEKDPISPDVTQNYWLNIPLWGWFLITFMAGVVAGVILGG